MSFSAGWLLLRERYDSAARNRDVREALRAHFAGEPAIAVVDLACGTGSTLRGVSRDLPPRQHWRLIDKDPALLAKAVESLAAVPQTSITAAAIDLACDLGLALTPPLDLITASALLDLVSPQWLDRLVAEAAARRLPVYAALNYDGRMLAQPSHGLDEAIISALNRHQLTDKGFGPALGPQAARAAVARLAAAGYHVVHGRSDWLIGRGDRCIQEELFVSLAELARITASLPADAVADWLACRRDHLATDRSTLRVGHVDLFACPMGTR